MGISRFDRPSDQRRALLRNLATSFLAKERIETTEAKAEAVARISEKMITLAKRGDLHARRQALAYLLDEDVVKKLFDTIGPRYAGRNGGYTRIVKTAPRRGDAAPMVILELV